MSETDLSRVQPVHFTCGLWFGKRNDQDPHQSFDKVLFCGDIIHPQIQQDKSFVPVAYIILDYTGIHFKLITYKNMGVFAFTELPEKIKIMMKNCEATGEGTYHLIPDVKNYKIPVLSGGKKTRRKREYNKKTRKQK